MRGFSAEDSRNTFLTREAKSPYTLRIPIGGYIPVFVAGAQPLSDEESSAVSPPVNEDMVQDHFAATSSHDSHPLPSTKVTPELLDDHTKATTWTQRNMLRGSYGNCGSSVPYYCCIPSSRHFVATVLYKTKSPILDTGFRSGSRYDCCFG